VTRRSIPATVEGIVSHIHDLGAIVVVQVTTPTGHPVVVILADTQAARSAARRWQPNTRHITATGTAPGPNPHDVPRPIPVLRARTIRSRPATPHERATAIITALVNALGLLATTTPPTPTPEPPRAC
jgi:hypothetical protein